MEYPDLLLLGGQVVENNLSFYLKNDFVIV